MVLRFMEESYQGNRAAAITKLGGMYSVQVGINEPQLKTMLDGNKQFGPGFSVVKIYAGINEKAFPVLKKAARTLEKGMKVDLDSVLDSI